MTGTDDLRNDSERLEQAFFAKGNAALLAEMRRKPAGQTQRDALREVVKIQDEAFLDRLTALQVRPETALAMLLIPLVFVAWADGKVDDRERTAMLDAARDRGVAAGRIAQELLQNGLARKPDPKLLALWKRYVRALWSCFSSDERWRMRRNLLDSARSVAEAAGGILGLTSKVSAGENRVLEDLERFLD